MIQFRCSCGKKLSVGDPYAGRNVKCPECRAVIKVPVPEAELIRDSKEMAPPRSAAVTWVVVAALFVAGVVGLGALMLLKRGGGGEREPSEKAAPGQQAITTKDADVSPGDSQTAPQPGAQDVRHVLDEVAKKQQREKELIDKLRATLKNRQTGSTSPESPPSHQPAAGVPGTERVDEESLLALVKCYSVAIPKGATAIVVNGRPFHVGNVGDMANTPCPYIFLPYLPQGTHTIGFGGPATPEEKKECPGFFSEQYLQLREAFSGKEGGINLASLAKMALAYRESPQTPLIPHFSGNYYAQQKRLDAAGRSYRSALAVCPAFGISHLNLAQVYAEAGEKEKARIELELARRFNIGNVFGISRPIAELARSAGLQPIEGEIEVPIREYKGETGMSEEDRRLVSFAQSLTKYFPDLADRAKMISNIGVFFARKGNFELGSREFAHAVQMIGPEIDTPNSKEITLKIYENILQCCKSQGWAEQECYRLIIDELKRK